jgi:hypothetical protein
VDPAASAMERMLAELRLENRRLRNLLRLTDSGAPPAEQPALALGHPGPIHSRSPEPDKVALFTSLFASRRDIFAQRWDNGAAAKSGWSPATARWYPKGTPLEDKDLLPLTPQVIERHLLGQMYIGLYPLLPDDTCW